MYACTFFGHRNGCSVSDEKILTAIQELISQGVKQFYVGNNGDFDRRVLGCLNKTRREHPEIAYSVVLAYPPGEGAEEASYTIYPEIERGPARFAISRRNRWMVEQSTRCICYVAHRWGGAYQFASLAKRKGLQVINLAPTDLI